MNAKLIWVVSQLAEEIVIFIVNINKQSCASNTKKHAN